MAAKKTLVIFCVIWAVSIFATEPTCPQLSTPLQVPAYNGPGYSGVFELHLSFSIESAQEIVRFKETAQDLGLKVVLIELPTGEFARQPQTSSYLYGEIQRVHAEAYSLAKKFHQAGFEVRRVKIEAVVNSATNIPRATAEMKNHPIENYFEFHFKVNLLDGQNTDHLVGLLKPFDAHLSTNAFKKLENGRVEKFITLRRYGLGAEEAEEEVQALKVKLTGLGYTLSSTIREYSVYDSNVSLDRGWIDQ